MNLHEWNRKLENYGSNQDPIIWDGREMTAEDLMYELGDDFSTKKLSIHYWTNGRFTPGTCHQMLQDRRQCCTCEELSSASSFPFKSWIVTGEPLLFATRQHARDFKRDESLTGRVLKVLVDRMV